MPESLIGAWILSRHTLARTQTSNNGRLPVEVGADKEEGLSQVKGNGVMLRRE